MSNKKDLERLLKGKSKKTQDKVKEIFDHSFVLWSLMYPLWSRGEWNKRVFRKELINMIEKCGVEKVVSLWSSKGCYKTIVALTAIKYNFLDVKDFDKLIESNSEDNIKEWLRIEKKLNKLRLRFNNKD